MAKTQPTRDVLPSEGIIQQQSPPARKAGAFVNPKLALALASGLLCAGAALGGTASFDFNSDPTANGQLQLFGNATWTPNGGVGASTNANDGYLVVTTAVGSQRSAIVFADFDQGEVVQAFTFEGDFRIGNGTQTPADGFSVNYVRAGDPVLVSADTGGNPATDNVYATGPNCEGNLPEEGTTTGISVGFDAWNSGPPPTGQAPCNIAPGSGITGDIVGIDIRVDGTLVAQFPTLTLNGACDDPTSLQTGPYDGSGSFTNLCWAHLKVVLDTNRQLSVFWKGSEILSNYQTSYFPSAGRLVFAGRTGGSYQNQQLDNLVITTIPAALALVGQVTGTPDGFSVDITDSGNSVVDTTKPVTLKLDGTTLTGATVVKNGAVTTVTYHGYPVLLAANSTHTITVTVQDTNGNTITGSPSLTVPAYTTLPASDAATGVDTSKVGFRMLPWQSSDHGNAEPNHIYWANEQLVGLHGANNANLTGASDGGYIDYNGVLNFNINPTSNPANGAGGEAGDFGTNNGYADMRFPGIPGANGMTGSSAEEILCYLQFQNPGVYRLGVNSDDGFSVTEGPLAKDRLAGRVLGQYDGGKGPSDVLFYVAVTNAGIYPMRLMWENGGGELPGNGAALEWFSVQNDGSKVLINDPSSTNTTGIKAFYGGPLTPAYVSQVNPYPNQTGARPDTVVVQLTDGTTSVNQGSIQLLLNGSSSLAPSINKAGGVTTISLPFTTSNLLPAGSSNQLTLVWSDNGTTPITHSNSWSFTVMPYGVIMDPSLSVAASAVDTTQPGFNLAVSQLDPSIVGDSGDGLPTQADCMNSLLAGLFFPWYGSNVVDTLTSTAFNGAAYTNNMWYWTNAADFNVVTSPGDFTFDYTLPGIPGVTLSSVNYAAAFDSWVIFPSAGFYVLGVNSDDGFRLSEGQGVTRQVLHVTGNGIDTDVAAVASTTNYGNGGFYASLPIVPVTAPVMYVNSNNYTMGGTINLTGKIALVDQGFYGQGDDSVLAYIAQTNGAVGFIEINKPANGLPYVMGGGLSSKITIPSLNVNGDFGQRDWWLTNSALTASIGRDANLILNSADYGKGMGHVDAGVVVPAAGAYPLHLLYFQGTGGAGMEFTVVKSGLPADGIRSLINDGTDSGSLMVYLPTAAKITAKPTVSVSMQNGKPTITYTGTLQSSPTVNGTYQNVSGASSPYPIPTGAAPAQFYRSH